ncbi:hypothetical protein TSAR_014149 [Trichomalopsis sarcophagae]|uniref:Uncharacterized protein n=1 Tax=Trichomalopsis sarcophagae TaxID=543379 RepID=A0A232EH73_9HYME|nr:hypothetical protein TSAR_014149 [Trichomalopsis sarcophagae]
MLPKTGKNCALLLCAFTLVLSIALADEFSHTPFSKKGVSTKQPNDFHRKKSQIDSADRKKKGEEQLERKTKPRSRVSEHIADLKSRRALKLSPGDSSNSNANLNKNVNSNVRINDVQQLTSHLYAAMKFRENVVRIFGYVLQKAESSALNEEQYTALRLVYEAVREKRVYFFDLLPPLIYFLPGERTKGKNSELELVLKILSKNLPKYLRCSAHFLVREFHYRNINIDRLVSILNPAPELSLDFFAGMEPSRLNASSLNRRDILRLQIEPIDESGKVTKTILGPIFVNLIDHLYQRKMDLSPEIFAIILANLPISPIDPILEANLVYISELAKKRSLPKWSDIDVAAAVLDKNPYNLVQRVITKLLKVQDANSDVIEALLYISIHLNPARSSGSRVNPGFGQIREFDGENDERSLVLLLLRSIVYPEFSRDALDARDKLIDLIERQRFNVRPIFLVVDRFAYDNPYDLLLAVLITWKKLGANEFAKPISVLLANVIFKKQTMLFSPWTSDELFVTDILPAILNDGPEMATELKVFTTSLMIRKENWKSRDIIVRNRTQCLYPKQCLANSLANWATLLTSEEDRRLVDRLKTSIVVDLQPLGQQYCPMEQHIPLIEEKKRLQLLFPYFPEPITSKELKMRNKLTVFILSNGFVDPSKARADGRLTIKAKLLYEILQDILKLDVDALDADIIHVVNYYLDLMKELQLVPSIIIRQTGRTEKELKIDLDSLLKKVIDYEKLAYQDRANYLKIMRYIEHNPSAINRSRLDLFKYKTNGKLARYILERLADNNFVEREVREAITKLIPHVTLSGVGAERIFVKKVRAR